MNIYGVAFKALGSLGEQIQIIRRSGAADQHGRTTALPVGRYIVWAEVTELSPGNVIREGEYELTANTIEVITDFIIQGPEPNILCDQIVWKDSFYLVTNVQTYVKNGVGSSMAICQLADGRKINLGKRNPSLAEEDQVASS